MVSLSDASGLSPQNSLIVLVSFEGPDPYARAGGLGVRVTGLAHTLADLGFETHLFFIGDPHLPAEETRGRLTLHRWGQWISAHHPLGVYDGEEGKRRDLAASLPPYLVDRLIAPAVAAGRVPIVLSEEWQAAEFACLLSDAATARGIRDGAVLVWNANNPYSFDRIDWAHLAATNLVTAVSRYMRSILRAQGVDALVIPNGIPERLLRPLSRRRVARLRPPASGRALLFKMARWEPEKGWNQALDAVDELRRRGRRVTLVARSGGPSVNGGGVAATASTRGLTVTELRDPGGLDRQLAAIAASDTDIVSLQFGVTEPLAQVLYGAADGVLANSVSEPFGLVGLEAMASRGLVYTGGTGEDYAVAGRNAVVLETLEAKEIVDHAETFARCPAIARRVRQAAYKTARSYTWGRVARLLLNQVGRRARAQGLLAPAARDGEQP
jgi:glycosyltransferase involved in cell wall biosynthesis